MLKKILPLLVAIIPALGAAETINLLEIPLHDKTNFIYRVHTTKSCSFEGATTIEHANLNKDIEGKALTDVLGDAQREANLEIDKENISADKIEFSLKGATNLMFEFTFKDCKLVRTATYDKENFPVRSIRTEFQTTLKNPVLEKLTINTGIKSMPEMVFYQWGLHDHVPAYSLDMGPGLQIRTNIRKNDQTTFHKSNPAIGPLPVFSGNYGPLFINRSGAGSLIFNHEDLSAVLIGVLEGEPYKTPGLQERLDGVFIGSIIKYNLLELTYFNDFFHQRGYNFKLNIAPKFYLTPAWRITPQAFAQYWDDKYVDYYFGVNQEESRASGLAAYKGKHTMNYGAVVEVQHYDGRWTYANELTAKFYGDEVQSSPTVVKKNEIKFITSVLYKFF